MTRRGQTDIETHNKYDACSHNRTRGGYNKICAVFWTGNDLNLFLPRSPASQIMGNIIEQARNPKFLRPQPKIQPLSTARLLIKVEFLS